eukprot:PhF_6_TR27968/c1_g1_i2/m.41339
MFSCVLFLSATLLATAQLLPTNNIRVIVTPMFELQPYDSSLTACANITSTTCLSGWPRLNARVRQLRAEVPYTVFVGAVDDTSRLVLFHPDSYAINHAFAARSQYDAFTIETFNIISPLESRSVPFVAKASMLPLLSNIAASTVLVSELVRGFTAVKVGPYNVILMNMMHSTRSVHTLWNEGDVVRQLLPPLVEMYKPDLVVLKMIAPDSTWDDWSLRLDAQGLKGVDVVIGFSLKVNVTTIVKRNGTWYIMQTMKAGWILGIFDFDVFTRSVQYKEQDLYTEISPSLSNSQEYKDDVNFLKSYVDAANKNDPVLGTSTGDFPFGRIMCRIHECEQGNLWANVLWQMSPTKADVCLINGGSFRAGWPAGPLKLSHLFGSTPFPNQGCLFSMWGSDLWAMMNYSVYAAPRWENDTAGYDFTGRFLQSKGIRLVYNSNRTSADGSRTRLISLEVWDAEKQMYEVVSRRRIYRILVVRYICDGGDGYDKYVKPVDGLTYLTQDLRNLAQQWILSNKTVTPTLDGHIYRNLNRTDEFILLPKSQQDCGINTMWVPSIRDCDPCPPGYEQPLPGQEQCVLSVIEIDNSNSQREQVILIATLSVGLTMLVIAVPAAWHMTKSQRHLRKVLDNNKVATELAEAVATLDFEGVAYLHSIEHPNRMQRAFLRIVEQLTNLRAFIPQAVLMKTKHGDGDDSNDKGENEDDNSSTGDEVVPVLLPGTKPGSKPNSPSVTPSNSKMFKHTTPVAAVPGGGFTARSIVQVQIAVVCIRFNFKTPLSQDFESMYATALDIILALNEKHRAVPTQTFGNDFVITFNAASKCIAKTFHSLSYSVALQRKLHTAFPNAANFVDDSMMAMGTAAGLVSCGDMGCARMKSFGIIGDVVDVANDLMRYSATKMTSSQRMHHYVVAVSASHYKDGMSDFALQALDVTRLHRQDREELVFTICRSGSDSEEKGGDGGLGKDNEWMYKMDSDKCRLEFNDAAVALVVGKNERLTYEFLKKYDSADSTLQDDVDESISNNSNKERLSLDEQNTNYCQMLRGFLKKK